MPIFHGKPDLLRRFRAGERSALAAVYDAYADKVGRLVRRGIILRKTGGAPVTGIYVSPDDFLDLTQEAFVKAFSASSRLGYDGVRDYEPYLLTIARNVLVDWLRRRGGVVPFEPQFLDSVASDQPALDDRAPWETTESLTVLEDYLAGLSPELARVHQHRYLEGLSQEAAARAMGISRQSLRTLEARVQSGLSDALAARATTAASSARRMKSA